MKLEYVYTICSAIFLTGYFLNYNIFFLVAFLISIVCGAIAILLDNEWKIKSLTMDLEYKKFEAICTRLDLILELLETGGKKKK